MTIKLFCSCTSEDVPSLKSFERALASLKRSGLVQFRSSQQLLPGADIRASVNEGLDSANVIVLLVSSSFIDSDSCWNDELPRAMRRHEHHEARLIPVLVGPCLWDEAPFAALKPLPADARPIALWPNEDDAWTSVAVGIKEVIKDIQFEQLRQAAPKSVREKASGADASRIMNISDELEALADQPGIRFSPEELLKWGDGRFVSNDIEDAIRLYRKAIAAAPEAANGWHKLAFAFDEGHRDHEEALRFYDVALALDASLVETHIDRSYVLRHLGSFAASVDAATTALKLDPSNARAAYNRACSCARAGSKAEALASLDTAIGLQPARYRSMARRDPDFQSMRDVAEFVALVEAAGERAG
ncbi:MAG: toll/interleukin-1 receptor domain-containing protein [Byssovorax sp.]